MIRNEVLKAAKNLRLTEKLKKVSISADMSVWQRNKLKELTVIRNNLNKSISKEDFYYGIRNNKVVKVNKQTTYTNEQQSKSISIENKQLISRINQNQEDIAQLTTIISKTQNTLSTIQKSCGTNVMSVIEIIKDMKKQNDEAVLMNVESIGEANKVISKLQLSQEKIITILTTLAYKYIIQNK